MTALITAHAQFLADNAELHLSDSLTLHSSREAELNIGMKPVMPLTRLCRYDPGVGGNLI